VLSPVVAAVGWMDVNSLFCGLKAGQHHYTHSTYRVASPLLSSSSLQYIHTCTSVLTARNTDIISKMQIGVLLVTKMVCAHVMQPGNRSPRVERRKVVRVGVPVRPRMFFMSFRAILGPTQPHVHQLTGFFPCGVKRPVREADHSP
jgi:hypothetical protein